MLPAGEQKDIFAYQAYQEIGKGALLNVIFVI